MDPVHSYPPHDPPACFAARRTALGALRPPRRLRAAQHRVHHGRRPGSLGLSRRRRQACPHPEHGPPRPRGRAFPECLQPDARVQPRPRESPHQPLRFGTRHRGLDQPGRGPGARSLRRCADLAAAAAKSRLHHRSRWQVARRRPRRAAPDQARLRHVLRLPRRRHAPERSGAGKGRRQRQARGLHRRTHRRRGDRLAATAERRPALCLERAFPRAARRVSAGARRGLGMVQGHRPRRAGA